MSEFTIVKIYRLKIKITFLLHNACQNIVMCLQRTLIVNLLTLLVSKRMGSPGIIHDPGLIGTKFHGHGCMNDITNGHSYDLQATYVGH